MDDKINIHCIDDAQYNLDLLEEVLKDEYQVYLYKTGQDFLDAAENSEIDIVLMDVIMPELGGFELCERFKNTSEYRDIPVIFLSAETAIESRIKGYTVGADDYITKPFNENELKAKINASVKRKFMLDAANVKISENVLTTMDMMTTLGETNNVIRFLQSSFTCNSYESIAKKIINTHSTFGLDIAIQFNFVGGTLYFSTNDIGNPLEESVFEYVRKKGRLIEFGNHLAVNYPHLSILIRNLPTDNDEFLGRIRDHVAIIGQGADSKIQALQAEISVQSQKDDLLNIVTKIEAMVSEINSDYKKQQLKSRDILSNAGKEFEDSFIQLGLTDSQEDYLLKVISNAEQQTSSVFDMGLNLDEKFSNILNSINETLNKVVISKSEKEEEPDNDIPDDDIVLF